MHLGNLLCALLSYLSVKSKGGKFIVRIEDLDSLRAPREAGEKILDTLSRLGLAGDEQPLWQSERADTYRKYEEILRSRGLVYPCFCSRAQLHAAEAPRLSDGGVIYAGTCRNLSREQADKLALQRKPCLRVKVPDETVAFHDGIAGDFSQNLAAECGDFIIRRSDGVYAYQLAVVADDGESGVTEIVRGADLVTSTPRQIWLARTFGFAVPRYFHIPLVCDCNGRKLSKSEGDSATALLSRLGAEQVLGGLAYAAGILPECRPSTLSELTALFDWSKVPRDKIRLPELFL